MMLLVTCFIMILRRMLLTTLMLLLSVRMIQCWVVPVESCSRWEKKVWTWPFNNDYVSWDWLMFIDTLNPSSNPVLFALLLFLFMIFKLTPICRTLSLVVFKYLGSLNVELHKKDGKLSLTHFASKIFTWPSILIILTRIKIIKNIFNLSYMVDCDWATWCIFPSSHTATGVSVVRVCQVKHWNSSL